MATEKMKLPIGYDDFGKVIDQDLQFVDKSLFIQDVIEDPAEVILITRPRRFGKTFNLSLLHYFFAEYVRGIKTQGLFDTLKIAQYPNYMQYQGKYPVINITFKDIKNDSIGEAYKDLGNLMSNVYSEYRYLLDIPKIYAEDKCFIKTVLCQKTNEVFLKASLKNLTRYLSLHHGVHP